MKLEKFVCESCGGNSLQKRGSYYECEYCGSKYCLGKEDTLVSKTFADAKVVEYCAKAEKYRMQGLYYEEFELLAKAVDVDSNNAMTLVLLGRCYRYLGFNDKAIDAYERAIEIDPETGIAYTNLGAVYLIKGNYEKADFYYKEGFKYLPTVGDDYWQAYANYAVNVAKLGNKSKARAMLRKAERHGYPNGDKCRELAGLKKL